MNLGDFLKQAGEVPRQTRIRIAARRLEISEALVLAKQDMVLSDETKTVMQQDFADLANGRPEAYVLGDIPFLDYSFLIDQRALIPRPETEDLCARVIKRCQHNPPLDVLDLCCGSGVMGLSMGLSFPKSRILLTDLSRGALSLCEENIRYSGMGDRAGVSLGDLWEAVPGNRQFDLIVANPPYVALEDEVETSVLVNEPHLALYSDDGGMAHIKRIIKQLPEKLRPGGLAAFELGHEHSSFLTPWLEARDDYQNFGWERDLFGVSRFLFYDCPIASCGTQGKEGE